MSKLSNIQPSYTGFLITKDFKMEVDVVMKADVDPSTDLSGDTFVLAKQLADEAFKQYYTEGCVMLPPGATEKDLKIVADWVAHFANPGSALEAAAYRLLGLKR